MKLGTSLLSVWNSLFDKDGDGKAFCNRHFLKDYIARLPSRGIKNFEFTWDPAEAMEALFDTDWKRYLEQCQSDWGLAFSVHLPQFGLDPGAPNAEIADASIREILRAIRCTAGLGITGYVLHVGITCARYQPLLSYLSPVVLSDLWSKTIVSAGRTLPCLLDHVDPRLVLIENLPYAPLDALMPIIEAYDFGICLDVGHADLYGADPAQLFEQYEDRIGEIHFHDVQGPAIPGGRAVDHRALGSGHIGYQKLLDTFVQRGFDGNLVIEVIDSQDEHTSVQLARVYLDSLSA